MKILELIEKYLLSFILIIFAVFVVWATSAPLVIPKLIILSFGVCLALLIRLINSIIKGEMTFNAGRFDIAVFLIMISYLVSGIFSSGNKMEAFAFPGAATFVIASCVLYFLLNQFKKSDKEIFSVSLIISGVLLSLAILFTQIQLFAKIPQLPAIIKDVNFNPTGGALPSLIYLTVLIPFTLKFIVSKSDLVKKLFFGVSMAIIVAGLAVNINNILPGKPQSPLLPSLETSWQIYIDTLKLSPILGAGPGDYITAFNLSRPLSYNQTDIWAVKFSTARNFYLTMLTEVGLLGTFALAVLFYLVYKFVSSGRFSFDKATILAILALLAIYPASGVVIVLLFVVLAITSNSEEKTVNFMRNASPLPIALSSLPFFAGIFAFGFVGLNVIKAEEYYKKSLEALSQNQAQTTYEAMTKAVTLNPRVDRYRASLAQVNMALASSIASKKDITEEDRNTISQLIQAAIAEAKSTVALNPQRSDNWALLASVYRSIMPFAQGADNFAIQTLTQAIALNPIDPNLRITLGGTYYALGRFDEAIEALRLAVAAKPDLANAHYNLSAAYREKGELEKAIEEMNVVLSLVEKDSADYKTASAELTALEGKRPPKTEEPQSLTSPTPVEESNIKPPIALPQEATPPEVVQ